MQRLKNSFSIVSHTLRAVSKRGFWGLLVVFFSLFQGADALAFQCGGKALTYVVNDASGNVAGVRCVIYNFYGVESHGMLEYDIRWYGEGRWGANVYRHLGWAAQNYAIANPGSGQAADFFGNGETTKGVANNLRPIVTDTGPAPASIQITGDWNETWHLVTSANYRPLPQVTTCGQNFTAYDVQPANGGPKAGVRCVLTSPLDANYWFGTGSWGTGRYAHLGVGARAGQVGEADDLCDSSFGGACGHFTSIQFVNLPGATGFQVGGDWNERWVFNSQKPPKPPKPPLNPCRAKPWLPQCQ